MLDVLSLVTIVVFWTGLPFALGMRGARIGTHCGAAPYKRATAARRPQRPSGDAGDRALELVCITG